MRILLVHPGPPLSQHDVWRGWDKALRRLGHEVTSFRTDEFLLKYRQWPPADFAVKRVQGEIYWRAVNMRPDIIFFIGTSFIEQPLVADLESRGQRVVLLHTESPYEDQRQLNLAPYAAVNLVNDPVNLADYESLGRPTLYVPHSYDPEIHYPGADVKDIDFTFIGTALPSRTEFFTSMNLDGLEVCIDGGGWFAPNGVANEDAAGLYRHSRVGINLYRREGETDKGWAMGPREVEMAACGLFFLRDPRDEGDELLPMLPTFSDPDEAAEELQWYLGHETAREECAIMAMEAVKERTFDNQAIKVMKLIKESL